MKSLVAFLSHPWVSSVILLTSKINDKALLLYLTMNNNIKTSFDELLFLFYRFLFLHFVKNSICIQLGRAPCLQKCNWINKGSCSMFGYSSPHILSPCDFNFISPIPLSARRLFKRGDSSTLKHFTASMCNHCTIVNAVSFINGI